MYENTWDFAQSEPLVKAPPACTGVLIVVPAYGQNMMAHTATMLYNLGQLLTQSKIQNSFVWFSMSEIVEARNVFLTLWYDNFPSYSHMLMIDSDMHVNAALVRDMIQFDKPLTGIFYRKREQTPFEQWSSKSEPERLCTPMPSDATALGGVMIGHPLPNIKEIEVVNGFMRCRHVGAGVMMIRRDVVETLVEKMPEVLDFADIGALARCGITRKIRAFDKCMDKVNNNELSEDYSICERWQQCGGEVWANISYEVGHIGPWNYKHRYIDYLQPKGNANGQAQP